jgi:peptide/nickel transport system substrate-binding protein
MTRLPTVVALLAAAVLAAAAPALADQASPTPEPGGPQASAAAGVVAYRIGTTQDYDGFNPFSSWSGITWDTFRLTYDFLTWYDSEYRPAPDLATSWETSEDGLTWTFTIREGMTWHDGEPLTAADVAFTYNLVLETEHWAYIQYLTGVEEVAAPDATTVVIRTAKPNAGMLALYIPILPEHVWKDADKDDLDSEKNLPLVGSGPFQLAETEKGRWIKLVPNRAYPAELGGPPTVDELYYVISTNTDAMIQDYKAGNLDAIVDWPASYFESLKAEPGTTVVAAPAIGFHELGFNCWEDEASKGDPLLRDVAIRQAVHWAIDKEKINALAMGGLAVPGTSLISPVQGVWHYEVPADQRYEHDPERAMQILDDAGYADRDGDGVRENRQGEPLDFRLVVLNEYVEDQAAAKLIVDWCADVGIKLRLDQKDEGAFGDEVYDDADYDMFIWSWGGDIDPGFMLSTFTTGQILNWGDSQYSNPEYDRLYVEQAQAIDPADPENTDLRRAVTDQMQAILYRDNPYIVLWYNLNLQAFRTDRWTGYVPAPGDGGAPLWNMLRDTYIDLEPVSTAIEAQSSWPRWMLIPLAAAGLMVAVVVIFLRRGRMQETE